MKNKLIVFFLWVCLFSETSIADTELVDSKKFRIGVIAPLSGALSEYGLASKNGIELAIAENAKLFSNIEFKFEDSQWDPKTALSSFTKLTKVDNSKIVYNWGNPTTEALAPIAESQKIPLIALSLDSKVSSNRTYVIRTINRAEDFSKKLADYLNKKKPKKIAIVLADNTYVTGLKDGLKQYLSTDIKIDEIGPFAITDQDFKAALLKIRQNQYDYIGVFLISGQISTFYRQMKNAKLTLPSFGTDFFESSTEIKLADGGMEGAVYPHIGVDDKFYEKYVEKFKNDYQIAYAGNAYDMAMVIGTLFSETHSTELSSQQVVEKLKTIKNFSGKGGNFSFDNSLSNGSHFHYEASLKQIKNNKFNVLFE